MGTKIISCDGYIDESWKIGDNLTIERRHFNGRQWSREHFGYSVIGTRDDLVQLGVCAGLTFPEGRKRVSSGDFWDWGGWHLRAIQGQRWRLSLRVNERIETLERLIALEKLNAMPQRGHLRLVWSAPANAALAH